MLKTQADDRRLSGAAGAAVVCSVTCSQPRVKNKYSEHVSQVDEHFLFISKCMFSTAAFYLATCETVQGKAPVKIGTVRTING